jgi:CRISPR type III-B/RAMP module-associated protein Cmr3
MINVLIEPTDVLFFRDAVPMSAGQGTGAGCRVPFPSTIHEAFRASLLRANNGLVHSKREEGRPSQAARKGNWHGDGHDGKTFIASRAFRSLQSVGPFPWRTAKGLLLPVPRDALTAPSGEELCCFQLLYDRSAAAPKDATRPFTYRAPCLPVAVTPPDKRARLDGWWTVAQMRDYLEGPEAGICRDFRPVQTNSLWVSEHRIGVEIDPAKFAATEGQLYAGSFLRPANETRFAVQLRLGDPAATANGEDEKLRRLDWLLLGGEFRLARVWHEPAGAPQIPKEFNRLKAVPPSPSHSGPALLKWVLLTPAIFSQGSLPGWCVDTCSNRPGGPFPVGRVCFDLPGRACLVSWCLGKPRPVSGWDVVEGRAKPTLLAVPEGSVYYFLCEDGPTAAALAQKLHWQPRSDFYGEKGCGYGVVSFRVGMHQSSAPLEALAGEVFV